MKNWKKFIALSLSMALMSAPVSEPLLAADFSARQEEDSFEIPTALSGSAQDFPETDASGFDEAFTGDVTDDFDFSSEEDVNWNDNDFEEDTYEEEDSDYSENDYGEDGSDGDVEEIPQTDDLLAEGEAAESETDGDNYDILGNEDDYFDPDDFFEEDDSFEAGSTSQETITIHLYNKKETAASSYSLENTITISQTDAATAKAPATTWSRKGYTFVSWNTMPDGSGASYPANSSLAALISANARSASQTIELYGTWKPKNYKITYKLNKGKNNSSNPKTYNADKKITLKSAARSGYYFAGWYKEKNFKTKVTTIAKGTTGNLTLYAKWVAQVNPSTKAAKINYCKGVSAGVIGVSATLPKYVKSVDNYYYLLSINPNTGKISKVVQKTKKPEAVNKKVIFKLKTANHPEYIQGKFAVGVKKAKKNSISSYTIISTKNYVSSPEKTAANQKAYFVPKTKKGIQSANFPEITDTNSKTAFFNFDVSTVLSTAWGYETYVYNGKKYTFSTLAGYEQLVSNCNAKGIQVTAQINLDNSPATQSLIAAKSPYAETLYYGWKTTNTAARQKMEAIFSYLSSKFGKNNCFISNWILGNEINSASHYYYSGNINFSTYCARYSEAFRCLYNAVRGSRASSKVFLCLDNCWNQPNAFRIAYTSRQTMDTFASKLNKLQKNVNWNVAYHAYSQPLTETKFWSSVNAPLLTNDPYSANFITMHNIGALTKYVKSKYGSKTRVILSEQGFSSSYGGEKAQAAALALAYYKAACDPMIDAFIIRSYQDDPNEVAQGLANGLKTSSGKAKSSYKVFKYMDSSKSLTYTNSILNSQAGKNWKSQISGYSTKRLYNMYRS